MFDKIGEYFTKNYGVNSITTALVPAIVQTATIVDPSIGALIASAFTPETAQLINGGGAGMVVALMMVAFRVYLGFSRTITK